MKIYQDSQVKKLSVPRCSQKVVNQALLKQAIEKAAEAKRFKKFLLNKRASRQAYYTQTKAIRVKN